MEPERKPWLIDVKTFLGHCTAVLFVFSFVGYLWYQYHCGKVLAASSNPRFPNHEVVIREFIDPLLPLYIFARPRGLYRFEYWQDGTLRSVRSYASDVEFVAKSAEVKWAGGFACEVGLDGKTIFNLHSGDLGVGEHYWKSKSDL
jgi:hypothetical protein